MAGTPRMVGLAGWCDHAVQQAGLAAVLAQPTAAELERRFLPEFCSRKPYVRILFLVSRPRSRWRPHPAVFSLPI